MAWNPRPPGPSRSHRRCSPGSLKEGGICMQGDWLTKRVQLTQKKPSARPPRSFLSPRDVAHHVTPALSSSHWPPARLRWPARVLRSPCQVARAVVHRLARLVDWMARLELGAWLQDWHKRRWAVIRMLPLIADRPHGRQRLVMSMPTRCAAAVVLLPPHRVPPILRAAVSPWGVLLQWGHRWPVKDGAGTDALKVFDKMAERRRAEASSRISSLNKTKCMCTSRARTWRLVSGSGFWSGSVGV
jgi:hypothetical protein